MAGRKKRWGAWELRRKVVWRSDLVGGRCGEGKGHNKANRAGVPARKVVWGGIQKLEILTLRVGGGGVLDHHHCSHISPRLEIKGGKERARAVATSGGGVGKKKGEGGAIGEKSRNDSV